MVLINICVALLLFVAGFIAQKVNIKLYKPHNIWDIAIFRMKDEEDIFNHDYSHPDFLFSPWRFIRDKYHYCTGYADPFLFVKDDFLYLFYEEEIFDAPGVIKAKRTSDFKHWEDLGIVLREPFHLSYPNVFEHEGQVYMIPETFSLNAVTLYKATDFPYGWVPVETLATGHHFADSDIFQHNGTNYLFTTVEYPDLPLGLSLYISSRFDGGYAEHPSSPLESCKTLLNWRCGGSIFEYRGKIYRPSQKGLAYYGENLGIWEITQLSPTQYEEKFVRFMHDQKHKWDSIGGHHFKSVMFKGERIVVMDGLRKDSWINNRTRAIYKKLEEK